MKGVLGQSFQNEPVFQSLGTLAASPEFHFRVVSRLTEKDCPPTLHHAFQCQLKCRCILEAEVWIIYQRHVD